MKKIIVMTAVVCLSLGAAGTTSGEPIATLNEENSTVQFDLGPAGVGMNQWTVDGINRLAEQSFWYRVGDTPQQRVNTLNLSGWAVPEENLLTVNYSDPSNQFTLQLSFLLTGSDPGSGVSDISETVKIKNLSATALDFHLYEYVDIDLLGTANPTDSLLQLTGAPPNTAVQTNGTDNVSETVVTPAPSRFEAGYASQLLGKLSSGSLYDLNDTPAAANGDLAWAFQWDATIGANKTFLVSKDKPLDVPEPSLLVLLGSGAVSLLAHRRRQRRRTAIT